MQINLNNKLSTEIKLNPRLIYAIDLLSMSSYELEKEIESFSEENVFIDFIPQESITNSSNDNPPYNNDYLDAVKNSRLNYQDSVMHEMQLNVKNIDEYNICKYIIYSLDEKGFLNENYSTLAKKFNVHVNKVENLNNLIKNLNIGGLSSLNIKDYFIYQADTQEFKDFIDKYYEDILSGKFFNKLENLHNTDLYKNYIFKMSHFKLYPLQNQTINFENDAILAIDVIALVNNTVKVKLNNSPKFRINEQYVNIMETCDPITKEFLSKQYNKAVFLREAIIQRNKNIIQVTKAIIEYQKPYFLQEDSLKMCTMEDISKKTDLSISTISRIVNDRVLLCNNKIYQLRSFFVSGIKTNDSSYSSNKIKGKIYLHIKKEDKNKPLSDEALCRNLNTEGIPIKRRTVSKYRKSLNIPNIKERKLIYNMRRFMNDN